VHSYQQIRRQRALQEAEGYLDLVLVLSDRWPPQQSTCHQFAQKALQALARISDFGGESSHARYLEGESLKILHQYDDAIVALMQASHLDRENIHILLSLGWCYKRTGRLDLAIQALEDAIEIENGEAIIFYNLACYWSLTDNVAHALGYLSKAFALDSKYRDFVDKETDFDLIRDNPDFQLLTSVIV